jgi:branched-chain amino acid transport system substrate-binding protein
MKKPLLICALLAAMTTTASAQISDDVVRIGVLTDLSSWGRDNSGPGSVEAAKMAVESSAPRCSARRSRSSAPTIR